MKKQSGFLRRLTALALALCMLTALTAEIFAADIVDSGYCGGEGDGTNLSWTLDAEGTLTISGTGKMANYKYGESPWYQPYWETRKYKKLVLCPGITSIGDYAFYNCWDLTGSLTIPDSVTTIGTNAFYGCAKFGGSLFLSKNIQKVDVAAFSYCHISEFVVSADNPVYCNDAYGVLFNRDKTELICYPYGSTEKNYQIPDGVVKIGAYAFFYCNQLSGSLHIPDGVINIGNFAFDNCSGFTGKLVIPDSVTSIGDSAFKNCSGFSGELVIPNSVTSIGNGAFSSCKGFTGSLLIPDSITNIDDHAFSDCSGFTGDLSISNNITSIKFGTFSGCTSFTGSLIIPDSVTSIGLCAFYGCKGFNGDLVIPDSVVNIEKEAFFQCSGFTGSLTIPASVTSIGENAFYGCTGFTGDLTVRAEKVAKLAFYGCNGFTGKLLLGKDVNSVGSAAFGSCSGLSGIYFLGTFPALVGIGEFNSASFPKDKTLYYIAGMSGWPNSSDGSSSKTLRGYKVEPWTPAAEDGIYEIQRVPLGDIVINGAGYGYSYYRLLDSLGASVSGVRVDVQYGTNGTGNGSWQSVSDGDGIFSVRTPYLTARENELQTVTVTMSIQNAKKLSGNARTIPVRVKQFSYSQSATIYNGFSFGISAGIGAGFEVGPVSAEAKLADLSGTYGFNRQTQVSEMFENGKRSMRVSWKNSVSKKDKLSGGIQADALGVNFKIISASIGVKNALKVESGVKIKDYDPTNWEQQQCLGYYLVTGALGPYANSLLVYQILASLNQYDKENLNAYEREFILPADAYLLAQDADGEEVKLFGTDAEMLLSYKTETDQTSNTVTATSSVEGDAKFNLALMPELDKYTGMSGFGGVFSIAIGAEQKNDSLEKITYKVESGQSGKISAAKATTTQSTTYSFTDDAVLQIQKKLGLTEFFSKWISNLIGLYQVYETIQQIGAEKYDAAVSQSTINKQAYDLKLPISMQIGLGAKLDLSAGAIQSFSYETKTGVQKNGKSYCLSQSRMPQNEIDAKKKHIAEIITEPIQAICNIIKNEIVSISGSVINGIQGQFASISGSAKNWFAQIASVRKGPDSAQTQSFAIMSLADTVEPESNAAVAVTLGSPYLVTVYTDESMQEEVADEALAQEPVELTLRYTDDMLAAAEADKDANVYIYYFDTEHNIYICQTQSKQDKRAQEVTVVVSKNGEYILATDNTAPLITDFTTSDQTSTPTISALVSDLSGIQSLEFWLDTQAPLVTAENFAKFYNEATGEFRYTVTTPLCAGEHTAYFRAIDALGNINAVPYKFTFTVDDVPPVITELQYPSSTVLNAADLRISARIQDDSEVSSAQLRVALEDGQRWTIPMTQEKSIWTAAVAGVSGEHTLTMEIFATDNAGNQVSSDTFLIQTAIPEEANEISMHIQSVTIGASSDVVVQIDNGTNFAASGWLLCAAYDKNGKQLATTGQFIGMKALDKLTPTLQLMCSKEKIAVVKVFLVDLSDGYRPLCNSARFDVK